MQKIGDITNTANLLGEFTDGNVAQGISPTLLPAAMFNTWQRELINVITGAGIALEPEDNAQLLAAIIALTQEHQPEPATLFRSVFSEDTSGGYIAIPVRRAPETYFSFTSPLRFFLQWKQVEFPPSPDGSLITTEISWPIPFPYICMSVMQTLNKSLKYLTDSTPFTSSCIVDRSVFKVASSYSKSRSTVTVWGVGH